jgi:hypothetical protein
MLAAFLFSLLSSRPRSQNIKIKIYKIVILPVLCLCKTWSLALREEHTLRVFENRMLRRIFGPKREEVAGGWRRLRNEELHNLYVSPNIIKVIKSRRMRWVGHVALIGEIRNAYNIFVEKHDHSFRTWLRHFQTHTDL